MRKYGFSALVAAGLLVGGLATSSASAADLGGNCCADLEERIAELEATTARKGNRKVSLTLSGWVGEQVMWWDDDFTGESNTYISGLGTTLNSHFKLTGSAQISPGWSAGYVIHVETDGNEALLGINQNDSTVGSVLNRDGKGVDFAQTVQAYWFIKSDQLGKVSLGLLSQASDNTALLVDGSGSLVPANYVAFDYGGFAASNDTLWFVAEGCTDCNGIPVNAVRYDSPTFGGFSVSASWGEDDFWDAAARYAGEHGGFKVAVAAAYSEATTESVLDLAGGGVIAQAPGTEFFQIGGYVQHIATGLFAYGAYGQLDADGGSSLNDFWYVKAGVRERWNSLGHTVLYGEYKDSENGFVGHVDDNGTPDVLDDDISFTSSSEVELWGVGIVQEIDAAAMSMWLSYRHLSGSDDVFGDLDDFQYVKFGALISF